MLVLAGSGDYSQAPLRKEYPREFLEQWKQAFPQTKIHIATVSEYLDAILPGIKSGQIKIPDHAGRHGIHVRRFLDRMSSRQNLRIE